MLELERSVLDSQTHQTKLTAVGTEEEKTKKLMTKQWK